MFWLLKLTAWVAKTRNIAWLASGSYGNPPNWRPWLAQLAVYNVIVVIQKLLMLLVLLLNFMQSVCHLPCHVPVYSVPPFAERTERGAPD